MVLVTNNGEMNLKDYLSSKYHSYPERFSKENKAEKALKKLKNKMYVTLADDKVRLKDEQHINELRKIK